MLYFTSTAVFFPKKSSAKLSKKKDVIPKVSNAITIDEIPKEAKWKAGMPCRLVYMDDGLEYEAVILRFVENDDCIVKYLGETSLS